MKQYSYGVQVEVVVPNNMIGRPSRVGRELVQAVETQNLIYNKLGIKPVIEDIRVKYPLGEKTPTIKTKHPRQPVELADGIARFKRNAIVCYLLESGIADMNKLALMQFSKEDRVQFAQLIGYSVDGAAELSYMDRKVIAEADKEVKALFAKKGKKK